MRYFYISYSFIGGFGSMGHIGVGYPNLAQIKKDSGVRGVTVLNIIELSKEDYDSFFEKFESSEGIQK
jgi:hypothetical protein